MVGELAALRNVLDGRRAIFLLPLKALVADKRRHFQVVYAAYGIRTVEATGETDDITPLLRGRYDIALLTYEKFAAIVLTNPHVLRQAGVIVIDEAQMIADPSRGANLEFILTLIRMQRRQGVEPQMIALSAVIGDTNGLEHWLAPGCSDETNDLSLSMRDCCSPTVGSVFWTLHQATSASTARSFGPCTAKDRVKIGSSLWSASSWLRTSKSLYFAKPRGKHEAAPTTWRKR